MVNVNKNVNIFSVNSNHHRTSGTRTYTRAMGQHSIFSQGGWHGAARGFNAYDPSVNLNRYARMREGLNNRWDNYEHYHHGPQVPQEQNPSLLETLMVAIPLGKQIFDFGKDIAKTFNIGGGKKTSKSNPTDKGNGVDPSGDKGIDSNGSTSFSKNGGLGNVQSFNDIKTAENNLNSSKSDIATQYANYSIKNDVHTLLHDPDVESGLEHVGIISNFDVNKLELKEINLVAPTDYKTALDNVETDIQEIGDFGKEIKTASGKVDTELGSVSKSIKQVTDNIATLDKLLKNPELTNAEKSKLTSQKESLDSQKKELEQKQTELNAAKGALANVETKIKDCKTNLEKAKSQITELQKQENELKDQKYDKAKQEDEKLGKVNKQIMDINSKIEEIEADGITTDEQSTYISLMDKLSQARTIKSQLTSSLETLGSDNVQNSKGKTYKIKNLALNSAGGKDEALAFVDDQLSEHTYHL